MPVFRAESDRAPAWCEVESIELISLGPGEIRTFRRRTISERIFVVSGSCTVGEGDAGRVLRHGDHLDIDRDLYPYAIRASSLRATIVRVGGHWGEPTGSCGVFELQASKEPRNDGDPVPYARGTIFDNHYHDCDEYWYVVKGRCAAVVDGRVHLLGPGDCLATGMGHHHDIPVVIEPILGVYFEGTLEGKKRPGHLWEHRDGAAQPLAFRM